MKREILIFLLCLTIVPNVFCQDNLEINTNWEKLNQQLKLRTEIVFELSKQLQKSKKIDKVELKNTELYAKELKLACEKKVFNKDAVDLIKEKNAELTTSLTHDLVNLELDTKLRDKEEIKSIMDKLLVVEKQLLTEIKNYNESCKKYKKEELIFNIQNGNKS
ncbi:hypothetical protein [Flavobacterium adhaerens]|uniref:hypothetical protein n=1 Tax=Flavobacterium adhaerens TaxID=3149043 RepID=UPI0032B3B306